MPETIDDEVTVTIQNGALEERNIGWNITNSVKMERSKRTVVRQLTHFDSIQIQK